MIAGELTIQMRDGDVRLGTAQLFVVPCGEPGGGYGAVGMPGDGVRQAARMSAGSPLEP